MPREVEESEWISDPSGSTWSEGEKVETRICAKCGHANLFNLVGRPIYSKYCPDCGRYMINYDRYWESREFELNEEDL